MSTAEYKCTGLKGSGKDGKCDETNPKKFLKDSTTKCLKCHREYQRNWYHANKMGRKVSEVAVFGEPYHAKIVVRKSIDEKPKIKSEKEPTDDEKPKKDAKKTKEEEARDNEKRIAKKDKKIAKLEKDLEKANATVALLRDWMEQISISAEFTLHEADESD